MTSTQLLEMLLSCSLQIMILTGACMVLERAFPRPGDRYSLWKAYFLCVPLLVAAGLMLPKLRIFQPWQYADADTLLSAADVETLAAKVLIAIWCIGAVVMLVRWIVHLFVLQLELFHCECVSSGDLQQLLDRKLDLEFRKYQPRLLISDDAQGPYCLQMHRPVIVIPRKLFRLERDQVRHILVHEIAHLQNNHPLQHFIQQAVQVICWFHPSVSKASSHASLVREYCCDDEVIRCGIPYSTYLRTLLRIAEYAGCRKALPSITFGKTPSELKLRAKRLVESAGHDQAVPNRSFRKGRLAVATLLLIACALTQLSLPTDPLASSRTHWSSWPKWSAQALHCLGIPARDYEVFDRRIRPFEQLHETGEYANACG
jgi:beta-lactamase regulating signal transducer with metallopeptidase domain